jgi:hypothetical protein
MSLKNKKSQHDKAPAGILFFKIEVVNSFLIKWPTTLEFQDKAK